MTTRPVRPVRCGRGRTLYHGTALPAAGRRRGGPAPSRRGRGGLAGPRTRSARRAIPRVLGALAVVALLAAAGALAWQARGPAARALAKLHLGRTRVVVSGIEYLSAAEVRKAARLAETVPLLRADLDGARRRLLRHPRVREARVERRLDGQVHVHVQERLPVALVHLGRLAEVDAEGRVLPPLAGGQVADLPVVTGISAPAGAWIRDPDFRRAVRWVRALGAPEVGLLARVSEVDVGAAGETQVVLSPSGVRVLFPADPEDLERLSAVRVVLADLEAKGREATLIDCRARGQAVVRAAERPAGSEGEEGAADAPRRKGAPARA